MKRLAASLAIHAMVAGLLLFAVEHRRDGASDADTRGHIEMEVVESQTKPDESQTQTQAQTKSGSGTWTASASASATKRTWSATSHPFPGNEGIPELNVEHFGRSGTGTGMGTGTGEGDGDGDGGGHGTIAQLATKPIAEPLPPPPPPKISKARPAKLVWPNRDEDVEDGHLFIAQVTVDRDGFVVGAHLTKGQNGPRDADAASLIFRFRYDPALDDDGLPIRSQVEQPFQVR